MRQAPYRPGTACVLDPSGAMVRIASLMTSPPAEGVVRFTFTNPPELLYDGRKNVVKVDLGELVTGP